MKETHLSLEGRITISQMLSDQQSFKQTASAVGKNCTSISREIRNHMEFRRTGGYGCLYNACHYRRNCSHSYLCTSCTTAKKKHCSLCEKCNSNCPDFKNETCARLEKPPYVCNGCPDRRGCTLEKHLYNPSYADQEYRDLLSESRSGISYSEEEPRRLDSIVSPLILKGQSLNHICANNKDKLIRPEH